MTKNNKMQVVGRTHMKVNKVDFSNVSNDTKIVLSEFQICILEGARLTEDYKKIVARLNNNINTIVDKCDTEGRALNDEETELVAQYRVELEKEGVKYGDRKKKLNDLQSKVFDFFFKDREYDCDLYKSYKSLVEDGKRNDFIKACVEFMKKSGCIDKDDNKANSGSAEIRKVCSVFHDAVGVKIRSGKSMIDDEYTTLTTSVGKTSFQKIFLAVFRDILVSNNVMDYKEDKKRAAEIHKDLMGADAKATTETPDGMPDTETEELSA